MGIFSLAMKIVVLVPLNVLFHLAHFYHYFLAYCYVVPNAPLRRYTRDAQTAQCKACQPLLSTLDVGSDETVTGKQQYKLQPYQR
jgi:hypothetical protein